MGLYRRPESAGSGKSKVFCSGTVSKILVASTFLSRIDPAYLLAVADEPILTLTRALVGIREEEQSFSVPSFSIYLLGRNSQMPRKVCPFNFYT
jgi:hypothetical protein